MQAKQRFADYEMLELLLFRAIARRDVKPLAKALITRFGSFAETVAARPERLREVGGLSEAAIVEIKLVEAAAKRLARGALAEASCAFLIHGGARLLPDGDGLSPSGRSFASCSSTSATR